MTGIDITLQPRVWADQLAKRLPRATEIVRSQRIITKALVDGQEAQRKVRYMALADKMKHLAERAKGVPASLEAMADKHLARLTELESRGTDSFGKLGAVLDATEGGIVAAEDALNQLTNGGDPL